MYRRCVGIELKELLLLLLGVQPHFTIRLFSLFVKATVLFRLNLLPDQLAFEPKILRETANAAPVCSAGFGYSG